MKLKVIRFGIALGIVWALVVFSAGLANLFLEDYGSHFLKVVDSIYPGYHYGEWGLGGVLVASLYAVVDAFVVGIILAWLYNFLGRGKKE